MQIRKCRASVVIWNLAQGLGGNEWCAGGYSKTVVGRLAATSAGPFRGIRGLLSVARGNL